jgi:dihydroorotate dehydrogenase (NAD+) catalytic subunit
VAAAVDLTTCVGPLRLTNPIIAASGTFGYGIEFAEHVDLNRLGGIVVKGLSLEPMEGAPAPRLCETPSGMLNAVGLQNVGVRAFVSEKLPQLRKFKSAIIANVFGHSVEEYVRVAEVLEAADGVAAYELNISCPNTARGGLEFGSSAEAAAEVTAAVKKVARRRLWVKLSPNVTDIASIGRACEGAGADCLTVANTYRAMSVDVSTRKPRLGRLTGGLSGPAIRPITLRMVYEVSRAVKIPVIGLGGIETAEDALEYLVVGAAAVQVGTASFVDPKACEKLVDGLEKWCLENKVSNLNEIRGTIQAPAA